MRAQGTVAMIAVGLACALASPASAGARFGIFGGGAQYDWQFAERPEGDTLKKLQGPAGGIKLRFALNDNVSLVIEGAYARKGQKVHSEFDFHTATRWTGWTSDTTFELHYLDVPAFLQLSLGSGSTKPYIFGGPVFGYLAHAREKETTVDYENGVAGRTHDYDDAATDDFKSTEVSIAGGVGVRFGKIFIEGLYMQGLTSIDPDGDSDDAVKNRGFEVRLGFELGGR
jgi:hypothetical protein